MTGAGREPVGPPVVLLASRSGIARVDLRGVARARVGMSTRACLADVWVASRLPESLLDLAFDLVGDDGFRSAERGPAIAGAKLVHAFIDVRTRDVTFGPRLEMPCYYHVKRLGELVGSAALDLPLDLQSVATA